MTIIPIVIGAFDTVNKTLLKGLGNKRTNGNLRGLAVTQTPVKDHHNVKNSLRMKIKEYKKIYKYVDVAGWLKNLWKMTI